MMAAQLGLPNKILSFKWIQVHLSLTEGASFAASSQRGYSTAKLLVAQRMLCKFCIFLRLSCNFDDVQWI